MKKVIIIGAGPAGLTAGYELLRQSKEYEVLILEESAQIGGIARTVNYKGNRMDIGGHRFFSKNQEVLQWWENMLSRQGSPPYDDKVLNRKTMIHKNGPDPEKEDKVMLIRNRVSRIYYQDKFFNYPVQFNWNMLKSMGFSYALQVAGSYLGSVIHKVRENSLEDFYINRFGRKLYSMFFESYTTKIWGRHPREISPDWGRQRVKGLSVAAVLKSAVGRHAPSGKAEMETSLIKEFLYPKYGPGQLWEEAAARLEQLGGTIETQCRVTRVITKKDQIHGVICTKQGQEIMLEADILISSMPLKELVLGMNEVPKRVMKIAEGLAYRDFVTVGLLVSSLKLQNETTQKTINNLIPDCWIYVQDSRVKLGRIQIFNNWSPYLVQDLEHTVFIGLEYFCDRGDSFWNMEERKLREYAVKELIRIGLLDDRKKVLDYHVEKVKNAYPAYFDTYSKIGEVIGYLNRFDHLYCVGRSGQHRYNNMDHSMMTSFEAVKNILSGKKTKENVWRVNTKGEYQEA